MGKLVIIDGNAILHRAFHAMPALTTKSGEPINAVYGFVSMLLNIIQNLNPTHLAVCFDEKEKTFRHKAFPKYQSQRPPTHEDLSSQFAKARDFLEAARISVYSKPGYEADDVIGTISNKFKDVVIVTGDRDILQLVDDKRNIKLFMPMGGLSSGKIFGEEETIARMKIAPSLIPDLKGLIGDQSDNYKGVAGIGPVTAIKLLNEFGSMGGIYKNLEKIPEKPREKLKKGEKEAQMSYKLATIVRDVPIEFDFEKMDDWDIDSEKVSTLFQEFGFKTLTERVKAVGKKLDSEKQMTLI